MRCDTMGFDGTDPSSSKADDVFRNVEGNAKSFRRPWGQSLSLCSSEQEARANQSLLGAASVPVVAIRGLALRSLCPSTAGNL